MVKSDGEDEDAGGAPTLVTGTPPRSKFTTRSRAVSPFPSSSPIPKDGGASWNAEATCGVHGGVGGSAKGVLLVGEPPPPDAGLVLCLVTRGQRSGQSPRT